MYPIDRKFAHATVDVAVDDNGREYYAATCDGDEVVGVDFVPYPDDPALGIIRAWYAAGASANPSADGKQAGVQWAGCPFSDFSRIVSAEWCVEKELEFRIVSKMGDGEEISRDAVRPWS